MIMHDMDFSEKSRTGWFLSLFAGLVLLAGTGKECFAQSPYVARAELPVAEDDDPFSILTMGEMGLLVVMKQNDLFSERPQRSVYFYDENLQQRWVAHLETESEYSFLGYGMEADSVRFVLAALGGKDRVSMLEIALCLADGRYRKLYHDIPAGNMEKADILDFSIQPGGWHFLAAEKSRYFYGRIDSRQDTLRMEEIGTMRDYDWCDMAMDTSRRQAYVLFRDARLQDGAFVLKKLGFDGHLQAEWDVVSPRKDIRLIDARMEVIGDEELFIGGTWNLDSKRQTASSYDRGTETAGLFGMVFGQGQIRTAWSLSYLDYPALDTLMSSEEYYKVMQAERQAKGRTILPDYLCVPRLERRNGHLCLTGEVYERVVNTTTEVSYDFYGRMMPYTRTEFEGFRYKNAFYSVFDSTGRNVSNSVFDIQHEALYMNLQPIAAVAEDTNGRLVYGYNSEGIVYYRGTTLSGIGSVRSFKLSTPYPGDRVLKTWKDGISPWYPGCFIAYGYQQVQNARRKGKSRQCVFYINKVIAE